MSSKAKEIDESKRREIVLYNKTLGGAIEVIESLRKELRRTQELQEIKNDIKDIKIILEKFDG